MGYFKSLENIKDEPDIMVNPRFSKVGLTCETFLKGLEDGTWGDYKIKTEISSKSYFSYDNFEDSVTRPFFQKIWTNKLFLRNAIELLDSDKVYRDQIISANLTSINHIVYDYITSSNPIQEIVDLMYDLIKVVDSVYIIKLCSLMPLDIAKVVTIARFSSIDNRIAIDRFNNAICTSGIDFSKKNIIHIYSIFFSEGFSPLFNVTMTTKIETFADRNQMKIYNMISLAILDILESMPSAEISTVLMNYADYVTLSNISTIRLNIRSLSEDYSRINNVIADLLNRGVSIP